MKPSYLKSAHSAGTRLIICLFLVCMILGSLDVVAAERQYLWQSRDQFVALEHQDKDHGGVALPNEHPADIALDRLSAILGSIDLRSTESDKTGPLFTKESVDVLTPLLQKGLRQASSTEDVTFAVIGLHQTLFGFARSPKVTTGRIFYKGGRLNIIVGFAQQDFNEREDRRLAPFTPGNRMKALKEDFALIPHAGQDAFVQVRKDWAAFDDTWRPTAVPAPVVEKKVEQAPLPSVKPKTGMQSPLERLTTLNELKEKGLITEEEYRTKRLEILNGL